MTEDQINKVAEELTRATSAFVTKQSWVVYMLQDLKDRYGRYRNKVPAEAMTKLKAKSVKNQEEFNKAIKEILTSVVGDK